MSSLVIFWSLLNNIRMFLLWFDKYKWNVSALSLYYRYYHGRCSDELKLIIPPKSRFTRSTRFANSQHSFAVKLEKCRTTSIHSLIRLSLWLQGIGTPSPPPSFRALTIFKPSKPGFTNTYASTLSLYQLSLLFSNARIFRDSWGLHHSGAPFLYPISLKKKKKYAIILKFKIPILSKLLPKFQLFMNWEH